MVEAGAVGALWFLTMLAGGVFVGRHHAHRSREVVPVDPLAERKRVHAMEHECQIRPTTDRCDVLGCPRAKPKRPKQPPGYAELSYPESVELFGRTGKWWGRRL